MRRVGSGQLSFVFADSLQGGDGVGVSDVSEAKAWLLRIARDKEAKDSTAQAGEIGSRLGS